MVNSSRGSLAVVASAATVGWQDYTASFSWRAWLFGWYLRLVAQVLFFALIGVLLDSEERTHFLLIGNASLLAAVTSFAFIAGATVDIRLGVFPVILSSPVAPFAVFIGRNLYVIVEALAASLGSLVLVGAVFTLDLFSLKALLVIPALLLISLSSYVAAAFVAALVLRRVALRNLVFNVILAFLALLCGANVPVDYLPTILAQLSAFLPLTHGLEAVRELLADGSLKTSAGQMVLEALVGLGWLAGAFLLFRRMAYRARAEGAADLI